MDLQNDPRAALARSWAMDCMDLADAGFEAASADASFRRYFRLQVPGGTRIVMDAPPEHEDCQTFVKVARLLRGWGLNAPEVYAEDYERGFLLLSDLGARTLLEEMTPENAAEHLARARALLVQMQAASLKDAAGWAFLPTYDDALLWRELRLFTEWYLPKHLGVSLPHDDVAGLEEAMGQLVGSALAQPRVFVHRDFMPRNLMAGAQLGVIDFQDAVAGPVTYDAICLFKDAFASWPGEVVRSGLHGYWEEARSSDIPVAASFDEFTRAADWMGLQRHLKVLGIFARLTHRDGKPKYAADTPRFVRYVMEVAPRYPQLRGLTDVFERHVLPVVQA